VNTNINDALLNRIYKIYNNWRGVSINKKIIVFESDDWGSIRMPSKKVYDNCLKRGYPVDRTYYDRFDSLESEDDLYNLFEILYKYKDCSGRHPVFTANILVANPDFDKIKEANFEYYFYETVDKTFLSYPKHSNCLNLWHQGNRERIFKINFHGREHLNVKLFLSDLQKKDEDLLWYFHNKVLGAVDIKNYTNKYVYATKPIGFSGHTNILEILKDGLKIFSILNKYDSLSYAPTNYILDPKYEKELLESGVLIFQGDYIQNVPYKNRLEKIYHYMGEVNHLGQIYLVRNCHFEPTLYPSYDTVSKCLNQIENAFSLNKPAIISTHRVNYIGYIHESNRKDNIKKLDILLKKILHKWRDVIFMDSVELGKYLLKLNN
jgi:hypothetical protein